MIVLLDFPRAETVAAARAIGAAEVLGKPFSEETLYAAVAGDVARPSGDSPFLLATSFRSNDHEQTLREQPPTSTPHAA